MDIVSIYYCFLSNTNWMSLQEVELPFNSNNQLKRRKIYENVFIYKKCKFRAT